MSVDQPDQPAEQGPEGADNPPDTCGSRPSKNRCQAGSHPTNDGDLSIAPSEMGAGALRPVSVRPGTSLRDEARVAKLDGATVPVDGAREIPDDAEIQARPWYRVVSEFRRWYSEYLNSHIAYESPEGETERTALENSYMPQYGDRYYGKLMDLQRGVNRRWENLTTVMLTFSASTLNAEGQPRCPADHMREIADGWDTARKQLHQVLSGRNWEYAKVWEPTTEDGEGPAGYGHMHVAVFVEDDGAVDAGEFGPVMRSYVGECSAAGWKAHRPEGTPCVEHETAVQECNDCKNPVSVVSELEDANLGTYISEYIGSYGKETLDRPMHEQAFYAVTWATRTRRVEFSQGAQMLMRKEQKRREFREETDGLEPEDCPEAFEEWREESDDTAAAESDESDDTGGGWNVAALCYVRRGEPHRYDPTTGVVEAGEIDGRPGTDPPRDVGGPPGG